MATAERNRVNEQVARALLGRGVPQTRVGQNIFSAVARGLLVQGLNGAAGPTPQTDAVRAAILNDRGSNDILQD